MNAQVPGNDIRHLIREAASSGITLSVDGDRLRYQALRGEMSPQIRLRLQSRKEEIIAELSRPRFRSGTARGEVVRFPTYWIDFWHQTAADPSLANLTHFVIKLSDVSTDSLEASVETVCRRHDLLCSRVAVLEGAPCLLLEPPGRIAVETVDLYAAAVPDRSRIEDVLQRVIWRPFEDGSLFRVCAVKTSPTEFYVAVVIHHFICDLPSCEIVAREMVMALRGGAPLLTLTRNRPIQYPDYLFAMDEWLAGPGGRSRLAYWKDNMAGASPVRLPQHPAPSEPEAPTVDSLPFRVDERLRAAIARAASEMGVTIATVVLAASFASLWSVLQAADLVTTLIATGRDDPALLGLVGATVNLFPVRVSVQPQMSYRQLIDRVREMQVIAQGYQVPWALLMRTLTPLGVSLTAPVFNFISGHGAAAKVHTFLDTGAESERPRLRRPVNGGHAAWMSHELNVVDSGTSLSGTVRYSRAEYSRETVRRYVESLISSLTRSAEQLDRRIGD